MKEKKGGAYGPGNKVDDIDASLNHQQAEELQTEKRNEFIKKR